MGQRKKIKVHNKSDKPDNILVKENNIIRKCQELEKKLPYFLRGFFNYLKGSVLPMSRLAYLQDINFFLNYIVYDTDLSKASEPKKISLEEFKGIQAVDVNLFIDYCRHYEREEAEAIYIYENNNKTLARKKSSISVMFKQLYRDGLLEKNITDAFDPIRVPKPQEREIKALQDNEVMAMLDAVTTGNGLTPRENAFWQKTKYRDKAILIVFLTYGLRLSELQQLNLSSFNWNREEFKIFRKRGKEAIMPVNQSTTVAIKDYINLERSDIEVFDSDDEDALFLSLQGRRMTERQIRTLVKKYTSIGMKTGREGGYSPHKLRATAATSLIGRGNSIFDVAALLDHEQVTTTQLYAAHKENVKRDLVKNMEWEIERKNSPKKE